MCSIIHIELREGGEKESEEDMLTGVCGSRLLDERGIHHGADKKKDVEETEKGHPTLKKKDAAEGHSALKAVPGERGDKGEHKGEHRSTEEHKGLGEKIKGELSPLPSLWKVVANEFCRETPSGTSLDYYPLESKKNYFSFTLSIMSYYHYWEVS